MKAARLDLGHLPSDDKLRRVLEGARRAHGATRPAEPRGDLAYWPAEFFGLDRAALFQDAPEAQRRAILDGCGRGLVEEAYFIEKVGVGFAAKMALMAETTEERALYGMIAGEEATHLVQVADHLGEDLPDGTGDPFLALLTEVVDSDERPLLLFVVQVMLEGWGLSHYRSMARGCDCEHLRAVFEAILLDEARHHGSGVLLFDRAAVAPAAQDAIVGVMDRFLGMVRVGPQRTVAAVEAVRGELSRDQRVRLLEELDTVAHSGARLATLRGLMKGPAAAPILERLEAGGAFEPLPAARCVP